MIIGKNPVLLNVRYQRPDKKKGKEELFEVIYKTEDGAVHVSNEPPEADIYIVKPECRDYDYNKPQERISRCDKIRCNISDIRYRIAEASGDWGKAIIDLSKEQRNMRLLDQLYRWKYAYVCDFQPEFYYIKNWYEKYELKIPHLSTAFLDIEIDQIDYLVNMDNVRDTAFAPVNLATVILEDTKESWTFCLRPQKPSVSGRNDDEFQNRMQMYENQMKQHHQIFGNRKAFIDDLHNRFDGMYGYLDYHVREYVNEIDLIADIFRLINDRKPNFCMCWNMRFDIQYLYYRIIALGYDPTSIMCHPDFKNPSCFFKEDHSAFSIEHQFDYFYCASYTMYICQMRIN